MFRTFVRFAVYTGQNCLFHTDIMKILNMAIIQYYMVYCNSLLLSLLFCKNMMLVWFLGSLKVFFSLKLVSSQDAMNICTIFTHHLVKDHLIQYMLHLLRIKIQRNGAYILGLHTHRSGVKNVGFKSQQNHFILSGQHVSGRKSNGLLLQII